MCYRERGARHVWLISPLPYTSLGCLCRGCYHCYQAGPEWRWLGDSLPSLSPLLPAPALARDLLTHICMRANKIGTCEKLYCNVNSSYKPHGHFIYLSYILHKSIFYHVISYDVSQLVSWSHQTRDQTIGIVLEEIGECALVSPVPVTITTITIWQWHDIHTCDGVTAFAPRMKVEPMVVRSVAVGSAAWQRFFVSSCTENHLHWASNPLLS